MPKRSSAVQLDQAIEAMFRSQVLEPAAVEMQPLLAIAESLRDLPRPQFRQALKLDLQRKESVQKEGSPATGKVPVPRFMRPGFNNIAPYILVKGAPQFIEFLKAAFEGIEQVRVPHPDGSIMHAQVNIGNSAIELGEASQEHPPRPCTVHLYVESADATYARALQAGATSVYQVADQPWGDRQGCVKDEFGNVWYIAMPKGWRPGPEGLRNVQPFLHLHQAASMIPFLQSAFGAEVLGIAKSDDGVLLHSTVKIGTGTVEVNEAHGEFQPRPGYLHVYVPDADALYARAIEAGGVTVEEPATKPYGERSAAVKDPFGNTWYLATYLGPSTT
jgi:PhnB protein